MTGPTAHVHGTRQESRMEQRAAAGWWSVATVLAVVVSIVGAFLGSGAWGGTPIAEAAGGALSADATPVAPAGPAFSIWSVIYLGAVGYGVWQVLPSVRRSERQGRLRPWIIASLLLNAAWIWTVQLGLILGSVVVIVALLLVLIRILLVLQSSSPQGWIDALLTDGTFGLYLGWVTVATVANITAWLAGLVADFAAPWELLAVALVVVAGGIGAVQAVLTRGRIAPALSLAWGLAWIAVGRSSGQFESPALIWTAALAAVAVLVVTAVFRLRGRASAAAPWRNRP